MTIEELYINTSDLFLQLQTNMKILRDEVMKQQNANMELQNQVQQQSTLIEQLRASQDED